MRDIAARIGEKIATGLLPLPGEPRQRVGRGSGGACAACDERISPADLEYEINIGPRRLLRFHAECLAAWKDGRYDLLTLEAPGPDGPRCATPAASPSPA
jgi:hypothetical protein